ncbi:MAG TPA: carbohydrate-binding family 9-like protein, partial [Thermoanaerobaculia bacterium]|nr:carbohydrate-binding family 9-like protein [Thermoanaerobaculia bacterium]
MITGSAGSAGVPRARVPRVERDRAGAAPPALADFPWARAAVLAPFVLADGSAAATQATRVRLAHDARALYVRFECADRDAWGTWRRRNDPIYLEEAVEVFLAPGMRDPRRYWELEVSPLGVLFAARIENPTGLRSDLAADTSWECRGLEWQAGPAGS